MFKPVIINAKTINDAWHQLVFQVEEKGRKYKITQGSFAGQFRYEFEFVLVEIERPWEEMAIMFPPGITLPPPSDIPQIEQYFANYIFNPDLAKDEQYTYGERIAGFSRWVGKYQLWNSMSEAERENEFPKEVEILSNGKVQAKERTFVEITTNQIEEVIKKYKTGGYGNNQCTIEIGMPSDILLPDPPCLRVIDTRIEEDTLHFFTYFRCIDSEEPILYKHKYDVRWGTLNDVYELAIHSDEVYVVSYDTENKRPVWGRVSGANRRTDNFVKNFSLMDGSSLGMTDDHWIFDENLKIKQAGDLIPQEDHGVRVCDLSSLPRDQEPLAVIDLFEMFQDDPNYYIRNLSLAEIKYLVFEAKSWWKDKRVIPLCEIDDLKIPKIPEHGKLGIARSSKDYDRYLKLSKELGYVLGAWEANGWYKGSGLLFSIGEYRQQIFDKLISCLDIVGINYSVYEQGNTKMCFVGDKVFRDIVESLGFIGGTHDKVVPSWIIEKADQVFQSSFFEGWFDGDAGCTVSKKLALGMRMVASLAGIPTSFYTEKEREVEFEGRKIMSSVSYKVYPVTGERGLVSDNLIAKRLKEIGQPKPGLVIDLQIEKYENFCVGNGMWLVHNSWDLWGGFPVNLGGIELLKQYMAKEIGVGNGKIIAASKGLHIYDHALKYVRIRRGEEA